jgi:diguanylate cyclase
LRRITVSVGVSEYDPGEPLSRILERADAALYAAKNSGRNCTSIKRAKRVAA